MPGIFSLSSMVSQYLHFVRQAGNGVLKSILGPCKHCVYRRPRDERQGRQAILTQGQLVSSLSSPRPRK